MTTARGAIPELVHDTVNGIIVDPPSAVGFRDAVLALASDGEFRKKLSSAALTVGEGLSSVADHASRMAGHYRTIL